LIAVNSEFLRLSRSGAPARSGAPFWRFAAHYGRYNAVLERPKENSQRVIFHLDMDAFYASVEQRENPSLKGKPVIVGSPPERRGVVCAASYEARKFGVRSAMPSATAGRLCPHGIFIPPRIDLYREESREVMRIVRDTGATIEQMSIDEAYMELTHLLEPRGRTHDELLEAAQSIGRAIKETIRREVVESDVTRVHPFRAQSAN
jgi:nucleotidyltransferase/DNA polymerase involved in DNA repair